MLTGGLVFIYWREDLSLAKFIAIFLKPQLHEDLSVRYMTLLFMRAYSTLTINPCVNINHTLCGLKNFIKGIVNFFDDFIKLLNKMKINNIFSREIFTCLQGDSTKIL